MSHSTKIGILILGVLYFCMSAGCSSSSNSEQSGQPSINSSTIAKSSLARDTNPQVTDAELAAVVSGNTEFALKLFPYLGSSQNENAFFSPYSITQAFSLLAPGARGTTLNQIEQTLSFPLQQDRRNSAFNKLDLLLASKTTGAVLSNGLQSPILNKANAVWGQQGFSLLPVYLDTLAVNYDAGLHLVDFIHATEFSRQTINTWVEGQTNNRIQNLIPQGGVTVDTRLVLTNAIWFKANWALQFPKESTTNRSFNNRDGSSSLTSFMRQLFALPYVQAEGCQAVDIPYAGDNLSMLVIMPDPGTLDSFVAKLTPTRLSNIRTQLATKMIAFSMPKFTFTKTSTLGPTLQSLGMTDAFDPTKADLSGIDGLRDLFVGSVFHQAFIAVDEVGTEAAAATAITIGTTSIPTPALTLTIDHPFIFLIRDRQTGLILFMGKVVSL